MSGVTIYMEGGGNTKLGKVPLRQGMNEFLGDLRRKVRAGRRRWRVVLCGDRARTYELFMNARARPRSGELVVLLVDAEAPVTAPTPVEHLRTRRGDGWDMAGVPADRVHLMVQTMETWIVADPEALADYYGQNFAAGALPRADNLEAVSKREVARALKNATEGTSKGAYHKTRHAGDLLALIDPAKARRRCPRCDRLFRTLDHAIMET